MADFGKLTLAPLGAKRMAVGRKQAGNRLRTVMDFADAAADGGLDWWPLFIRHLADTFDASACLIWHEFGVAQKGELLLPVPTNDEYVEKYKEHSHLSPWLQFLWSRHPGFFIDGEEHNPLDKRTNGSEADKQKFQQFLMLWLVPQNLIRGLGAVLLKDKARQPGWAVGLGILRPDGDRGVGLYTQGEKQIFKALIPFMLRHIERCPAVMERISRDKRENQNYAVQATNGVLVPPKDASSTRVFLDTLSIKDRHRAVVARVIDAAERGDEALLDKVQRSLDAPKAGQGGEIIAAGGQIPLVPPPPKPGDLPLYDNTRPRNLQTGRLEGVDTFFTRVYGPWIVPDPEGGSRPVLMLPRKLIEELDPDCDRALAAWPNNHRGQEFPIKIARKGSATPPTPPLTGQIPEVWRSTSRAESYKQRRLKQAGEEKDR